MTRLWIFISKRSQVLVPKSDDRQNTKQQQHTLTVGGLSGGDLQGLGGHTDRSLHVKVLILGTSDQIGGD